MLPLLLEYRILQALRVLFSFSPSSFSFVLQPLLLLALICSPFPFDAPPVFEIPAEVLPSFYSPFLPPFLLESLVLPTFLDTRTLALPHAYVFRVPAIVHLWVSPKKFVSRRHHRFSSSHPSSPFFS